jgi:hypothetical protein
VRSVPQVRAVSGVAGEALVLRERDQREQEAGTIGRAVRDIGDPYDRGPHSPLGEVDDGGFHDVANPQGALVLIADGKGGASSVAGRPSCPDELILPATTSGLFGSRHCLAVGEHDGELRGGHDVHPANSRKNHAVGHADDEGATPQRD